MGKNFGCPRKGFWEMVFVLAIGLMAAGCSTSAASKPGEGNAAKTAVSSQKTGSSLEAYEKGTLGKGGETGPLADLNFDFDRYSIRPDARAILKQHAGWLKANPQVKVEIEGHCDERGTSDYNLALGVRRADAVKQFLVASGIGSDRLSIISYGEELPLCKEQSESCWAKNRRAHFALKTASTN
jgi:peptidoglycan-associated lipoprotein